MDKKRLRAYRGNDVSMIFQDPMTSLNPTMVVVYDSLFSEKYQPAAEGFLILI